MSHANRLPLGFQHSKKKNENLISKIFNKSEDKDISNDSPDNIKVIHHKYNTRRNSIKEEPKFQNLDLNEEKMGNVEYSKVLIKCLKEAIDENEKLRDHVELLTTDNVEMKNEIQDKTKVIEELYDHYENCKLNHCTFSGENSNSNSSSNTNSHSKSHRIQIKPSKKGSKSI